MPCVFPISRNSVFIENIGYYYLSLDAFTISANSVCSFIRIFNKDSGDPLSGNTLVLV
jgi:hypothetical protein